MSTKTVEKKDSYYRDVLRKFTAHKLAMIGVAIILLEVILVIVLPMIMKLDPYTSDILAFSAKPGAGQEPMIPAVTYLHDWFTEAGSPFWWDCFPRSSVFASVYRWV